MRFKLLCLLLIVTLTLFSGCWDSRELDQIYVTTGLGVDVIDEDNYNLTVQIANTQKSGTQTSGGGGDSDGGGKSFTISAPGSTIMNGINHINKNSNRELFLDHTLVVLFSKELVEGKGLRDILDMFIRMQETRLEVPVFICEGSSKEILSAELERDSLTANFLYDAVEKHASVAKNNRVRILDFLDTLLCPKQGVAIPLVKLEEKGGNQVIEHKGMAALRNGKMLGTLLSDEVIGYNLTEKKTKRIEIEKITENGKAVYLLRQTKCKPNIKIDKDNPKNISIDFNIQGISTLAEMQGFIELEKGEDLIEHLEKLINDAVKDHVEKFLAKTQEINVDVFPVCEMLYKNHFNIWKKVIDDWEEIFPTIQFSTTVDIRLTDTGDISESITIKQKVDEEKLRDAN